MVDTTPYYSPRYEVKVEGTKFRETGGRIANLAVETALEGADRFSFDMNYAFNPSNQQFQDMSWGQFKVGNSVEISMGWGGTGSLTTLFKGKIHNVKADFNQSEGPVASVSGFGKLHKMMNGTKSRSWKDTTVGSVVKEVLGEYASGSKLKVKKASIKQEKLIQHNESDYQFVARLAEKHGFRFYGSLDTIQFIPRSEIGGSGPVATLNYGEGLKSFTGEIDESNEVSEVDVRYWDMKNEKEVVGSASTNTDTKNDKKEVFRVQCWSKKEAKQIAERKLAELSDAVIQGHAEAEGNPKAKAGEVVKLKDMGQKFSGKYFLTKATHRMGPSGYRTSMEMREVP